MKYKERKSIVKWHKDDLAKYLQAKEYVDTLLIPTISFQVEDEANIEKDAFKSEVLTIYLNEIEKELSGRVFVTPAYSYIKQKDLSSEVIRLNTWIDHLK